MTDLIAAADFRTAMARLASAVTLVTTDGPGGRRGMAATAVTSVTDDPPTVLVCVNRSTRSHALIQQNGIFAVNVLSADQQALVPLFSGGEDDPFAGSERWHRMVTGAPVLRDTITSLDCVLDQTFAIGTHSLFVGRVVGIAAGHAAAGLVYFDRQFAPVPPAVPA